MNVEQSSLHSQKHCHVICKLLVRIYINLPISKKTSMHIGDVFSLIAEYYVNLTH